MATKHLVSIDLNGNEIQNVKIQNLAADPTPLGVGHIYYNTVSLTYKIYNGTVWVSYAEVDHEHVAEDITDLGTAATKNTGTGEGNIPVLGAGGKLASTVLPSYVDDVLEFANLAAFPATGESGIIYFAIDTGRMYRWSGSVYAQITSGGAVDSVNGKTGVVTLTNTDVGAAAASHTHGNITNAGAIGSTTNQIVVTTTGGVLTTEAKPTGYLPLSTLATNIKMAGVQSLGSLDTLPRADHVHPVDTSREPAIGTKKTAFNKDYGTTVGDVKMNGVASVGSVDALARIDHVHPKDTSKTGKHAVTIGDGTNVSYIVTHNLGTTDVTVLIYDVLSSPYAQVYTDVEITGANSITVRFATAPASGKYRVIVVG